MRLKKAALFATGLLFATLLQAQLLTNPGFENDLNDWQIKEKRPISFAVAEAAFEGKLGLRLNDEATDAGANLTTEKFEVTPGQKISLGFMARSSNGSLAAVLLSPILSDGAPLLDEKGQPSVVAVPIKSSPDWSPYRKEYTVPEGVTSFTVSIRSWSTPTGVVDIDNFELRVE